MRPQPPPPDRPSRALTGGLLAALSWLLAGLLGLPQVLRLPFLPLVPVVTAVGAWLATTRARLLPDMAAAALVILLMGVGFTPLLEPLARAVIRDEALPAAPADAVVVLSAALTRDGVLTAAGTERLLHGVLLLRGGIAPTLVTTRLRRVAGGDTLTSDADQARIRSLAPDSVRWLVADSVASTRDEAVRVAEIARREGWTHVVVVTSALHSRRACAAFRRAGLLVTCSAAPSSEYAVSSTGTPGERWRRLGPLLHELVGWWWYGVRGWR